MTIRSPQTHHQLRLATAISLTLSSILACSGGTDATDGSTLLEAEDDEEEADDAADDLGEKGMGGMGGMGGGTAKTDDDAPGDEGESPGTPQILESYPTDGMAGVLPDADFSFQFDQPMDHDSVEANFSVEGLELEDYDFVWNEDFTELTVEVLEGLKFESGDQLDQLVATDYHIQIDGFAKSQDGVAIGDKYIVSFTVARHVTTEISPIAELTGSVRSDSTNYNSVWCGDSQYGNNSQYIGVVSFDLAELEGTFVQLHSADLSMLQSINQGSPYLELGDLNLHDVEFSTRTWAAVQDGWVTELYLLSDDDSASLEIDVSKRVLADFTAERLAQFSFEFETPVSEDVNSDNVAMSNLLLTVGYWAE